MLFNLFSCNSKSKPEIETNETVSYIDSFIEITEFNNGRPYQILTKAILDSIPDYHLIEIVYDNIETKFKDGDDYSISITKNFSKGQKAIFSIWWLKAEILNGGFNQYFYNPSGKYRHITENGLKELNALRFWSIMKKANEIHDSISSISNSGNKSAQEFINSYNENPLNDLDSDFYELDQENPLDDIVIKYIRNNTNQFVEN